MTQDDRNTGFHGPDHQSADISWPARPTADSSVDRALAAARRWRARPLARDYALVLFGHITIRTRSGPAAIATALGIRADGAKSLLGLWPQKPGREPWAAALTDLRRRGVCDIAFAVPGHHGPLSSSIAAAFPAAVVAQCPVRALTGTLERASMPDRKAMQKILLVICGSSSAVQQLDRFMVSYWRVRYPGLVGELTHWRREIELFFALPVSLRQLITCNNPAASLSAKLQRGNASVASQFASLDHALVQLPNLFETSLRDWRVAPGKWRPAFAEITARLASGHADLQAVSHANKFRQ